MKDGEAYTKLFTPRAKKPGRPKGSGDLRPPEHKCTKPVKLTPELYGIVESEQRHGETISDAILRMLKERTYELGKMQKKVNALIERLEEFESLIQRPLPILRKEDGNNEQILLQNLS